MDQVVPHFLHGFSNVRLRFQPLFHLTQSRCRHSHRAGIESSHYGQIHPRLPQRLAERLLSERPRSAFVAFNFAGTPGASVLRRGGVTGPKLNRCFMKDVCVRTCLWVVGLCLFMLVLPVATWTFSFSVWMPGPCQHVRCHRYRAMTGAELPASFRF